MISNFDSNKYKKLEISVEKNRNNASKIQVKNRKKQISIDSIGTTHDVFCTLRDLSSDFIECNMFLDYVYNPESGQYELGTWTGEQYLNWTINLGIIDIRNLPFLQYDIIYMISKDTDEPIFGLKNFFFSYYPKVSESADYERNVLFHAGIHFVANTQLVEMNPIQAKLILVWNQIPIEKVRMEQTINELNDIYPQFDVTDYLSGWTYGKPNSDNPLWPGFEDIPAG